MTSVFSNTSDTSDKIKETQETENNQVKENLNEINDDDSNENDFELKYVILLKGIFVSGLARIFLSKCLQIYEVLKWKKKLKLLQHQLLLEIIHLIRKFKNRTIKNSSK